MKILVVFTGGTIGSRVQNGWIAPDRNTKYSLVENYKKECGDDVEFVCTEPYFVLSENLSAKEINTLIGCVCDNINKDYDGIIITHGTDTLQYSGVALSFAVGNNSIPILMVSANYPLEDSRSNGQINFKAAVEFIKQGCGQGVYISYKNRNDSLKFHSALKALSYGEADDLIHSLYEEHYAEYTENGIVICGDVSQAPAIGHFTLCERPKILTIAASPADGFDYDIAKYNAIILRPYHSGTLNTENSDFKRFCSRAKELDIPIFITNIHSGAAYESAKVYEELDIIPLPCSTFVSVFMRIWVGISRDENLKELF